MKRNYDYWKRVKLEIIDIHAHTSDKPMRNLYVTSASLDTIETEAAKYGITSVVLLATYFPLKGTGVHNTVLLERIQGRELFTAFGSLDTLNALDDGIAELEFLACRREIAGIKLYPGYQVFEVSDPKITPIWELAEKYQLPIMMHGGEVHHCPKEHSELAHPRYVEKPAKEHPNLKFCVSHLANPYFSELRKVMQRCPNIYTDISGQFVSASHEDTEEYRQEIVNEIKQFLELPRGTERVMFGTDFPIQSYEATLDLVNRLKLDSETLKNVLSENAKRYLNHDVKKRIS